MKILIVDDTETNRIVLGAMLQKDGHMVSEAVNGQEGVEVFERERPDLVIMDIMMPVMDGYQATALIKQRIGDRFVPVIFLTSLTDEGGLAKCISHGGDDFLTKPFSHIILRAKIQALTRIRELHTVVKRQNDELLAARKRDEHDREMARVIFQKILGGGSIEHPNVAYCLSPAELLGGDLLLAAFTPHGLLHLIIGDFTGHGLAAAVGAVPVAEVFYSMTRSGFGIGSIAAEINHKLRMILPTNLFCAACLLEWDPVEQRITVWNGGMPDGLLVRPSEGVIRRMPSRHLPLSLLKPEQFDAITDTMEVHPGDRIYLYSDGLIEARNLSGEMFGQYRLEQCVTALGNATGRCDHIQQEVIRFCAGYPAHDDIALVELTCDPALPSTAVVSAMSGTLNDAASRNWHLQLVLEAEALKRVDPVPTVMRTLTDIQGLAEHKQTIFTILAELITNAIDHGLLSLDSSLKSTPEGFAHYYDSREVLLGQLQQGILRIKVQHTRENRGGRLAIRVEDSGHGFDFAQVAPACSANRTFGKRGIPLLRDLCHTLTYYGNGNTVEAVYVWS